MSNAASTPLPLSYPTTMRRSSSTTGGLATMPFGQAADLGERARAGHEVDAHEVQRRGGDPAAAEGAGVALAPGAVVEEPRGAEREHGVPAVGLARHGPVRGRRSRRGRGGAVPAHAEQAVGADDVHVVAVGRQARDRRFGQLAAGHDRRASPDRARAAPPVAGVCADRSWPGSTPPKSFVTRWPSGSTTKLLYGRRRGSVRDASTREVGSEPVGVVAEHDVQRAVRVRGETTRPGRARRAGRRSAPSTSSVTGSTCSTQLIASGPAVCRRRKASPGSRSTSIVAAIASRDRTRDRAGLERGPATGARALEPARPAVLAGPVRRPVAGIVRHRRSLDGWERVLYGLSISSVEKLGVR